MEYYQPMRNLNLSKRMEAVVDMVPPQSFVIADVGCDHAYVSIALIERKMADKVIAMDVRRGPLEIAANNVKAAGLQERITLRLSDGLEQLATGEADTIIIAGMGGLLVKSILEKGQEILDLESEARDAVNSAIKRPTLVLQPQSDLKEVRIFLYHHAYHIVREKMLVEEGKYYTVIKAEPCSADVARMEAEKYNDADWLYGQYNLKKQDEVLYAFLKKEKQMLDGIYDKITELMNPVLPDEQRIAQKTVERWHVLQEEIQINRMALECYVN